MTMCELCGKEEAVVLIMSKGIVLKNIIIWIATKNWEKADNDVELVTFHIGTKCLMIDDRFDQDLYFFREGDTYKVCKA